MKVVYWIGIGVFVLACGAAETADAEATDGVFESSPEALTEADASDAPLWHEAAEPRSFVAVTFNTGTSEGLGARSA